MTVNESTLSRAGALLALVLGAGAAGLSAVGEPATAEAAAPDPSSAGPRPEAARSGPLRSVRPAPGAEAPDPPDTVIVEATDRLVFRPDSVAIEVGDAVRWRNAGVIRHTATADPSVATLDESVRLPEGAEPFDSGRMGEGETFTHVFTVPGRYEYFCIPHEGAGMRGTVLVEE